MVPGSASAAPLSGVILTKSNRIAANVAGLCLLLIVAVVLVRSQIARAAPQLAIPKTVGHAFTLHDHGDYFEIRQDDYRRIFIDSKALQAFVHYHPGEGLASLSSVPAIFIHVGGKQFRLDCVDDAAVDTFIAFAQKELDQ
jgi:hypothetical protein